MGWLLGDTCEVSENMLEEDPGEKFTELQGVDNHAYRGGGHADVSSDASVLQPLKPSHFQKGKSLASLPPKTLLPQSHATSVSREDMGWRYLQRLSTSFWNC